MDSLALLPLFKDLRGRKVLICGDGGVGLAWKAELILAAGAHVAVVFPQEADLASFQALEPQDRLTLHQRPLLDDDFSDAAFAIGDFEAEASAIAFARRARDHHVLVNLVDKPALSDVQFGAIVNRSPIVVSIATDGQAPSLGRAIRGRIDALLPQGLERWAVAARNWRGRAALLDPPAKRAFWAAYSELALENPSTLPEEAVIAPLLAAHQARKGQLVLIATGLGDTAEHITLQALGYLQRADVIYFDPDAHRPVLNVARREALQRSHAAGTEALYDDLEARLREGACVVALYRGFSTAPHLAAPQWATFLERDDIEIIGLEAGGRLEPTCGPT
jgi:uroporphyrin-III C-methyltransferase / precorrin-2 dehydrogenase / sirohydrochlorin ferrochelatase